MVAITFTIHMVLIDPVTGVIIGLVILARKGKRRKPAVRRAISCLLLGGLLLGDVDALDLRRAGERLLETTLLHLSGDDSGGCSDGNGRTGDNELELGVFIHGGFSFQRDVIIGPVKVANLRKRERAPKSPLPRLASVRRMGYFEVDGVGFHRSEELRDQPVGGFGFFVGDDG